VTTMFYPTLFLVTLGAVIGLGIMTARMRSQPIVATPLIGWIVPSPTSPGR
jgi:hypothetical protein